MTVALIGGLDRLERRYLDLAAQQGIDLRVFTGRTANLTGKISQVDAVIMFTNLVSHQSAREVYRHARDRNLCLICKHSSSLSTAKACFDQVRQQAQA